MPLSSTVTEQDSVKQYGKKERHKHEGKRKGSKQRGVHGEGALCESRRGGKAEKGKEAKGKAGTCCRTRAGCRGGECHGNGQNAGIWAGYTGPPAEAEAHDACESWEKTENGTYSDVRAETPAETELEGKPENTEESGPVTGTVDDTEPDAGLEPEQEPETEPGDKPEPEPVAKPETESVAITERNPVSHGPEEKPASIAPVQVVESPLRRMKQEFRERSQIIKEQMLNIQNAFITIGFQLHWIRNNNMYRVLNYKNVYEYAEKEYGIKKTTCCNFISIIENYAKRDASGGDGCCRAPPLRGARKRIGKLRGITLPLRLSGVA